MHSFLEQWGLINYDVDAETKPVVGTAPAVAYRPSADPFAGGVQPQILNPTAQVLLNTEAHDAPKPTTNLPLRQDLFPRDADFNRPICSVCGLECLSRCFASQDAPSRFICEVCVRAGRLPPGASAATLVQMPAPEPQVVGGDWTEAETLLLLEGIEMFGDNWQSVADHVGSRTVTQCIVHFLRLPIDEPYLPRSGTVKDDKTGVPLPFSEAANPIMSLIAYLASMVSPAAAAAAAQSALQTLTAEAKTNVQLDELSESQAAVAAGNTDITPLQTRAAAGAALAAAAVKAKVCTWVNVLANRVGNCRSRGARIA